jgi:hypothetical protein
MLQHFEQQLKKAQPLTESDIAELVKDDIADGCDDPTEYYNSKLGQRMLFYLFRTDEYSKYEIVRVFENDIESELKNKVFIDESAATPRFTRR